MTLLSAFLQGALVILVLMQMSQSLSFGEFQYCAYPSPIPLLLAALKLIHARRTRGCAPVTWHSSNHSGRSNNGFPCTFSLSPFALFFSVSAGSCDGLPHTVLLELSLLVDAGCNVGTAASCNVDVGDVGAAELEEFVDKPGTKIGT